MTTIQKINKIFCITIILIISGILVGFKQNNETSNNYGIINEIINSYNDEKVMSDEYIKHTYDRFMEEKVSFEKYFILGYLKYYKNDFKGAKIFFEEAMNYIEEEKNLMAITYNGDFLIKCLAFEGDYNKAKKVYEKICENVPKNEYGFVYVPMMSMATSLSVVSKSSYVGIEALENIKRNIRNLSDEKKIELYKNYYQCYTLERKYSMASKYILKAIKLAEKLGDNYSLAELTADLGSAYSELRDYENGEKTMKEALDILKKSNKESVHLKQYILTKLIRLYEDTEQYEKALELIRNIDYLKRKNNLSETKNFNDMKNIIKANVCIEKKNFHLAKNILDDLEIENVNKNIITEVYTYYYHTLTLGQLNFNQGYYDNAILYYKECLNVSNEFNGRKINVYENIIEAYDEMGDEKSKTYYQNLLIDAYKKDEAMRNEENRNYILENLQKEDDLIRSNDKKIIFYKGLSICIISIFFIISFLIRKLKNLKKQTITDGLTRIYNRRCFDYQYYRAIVKNEDISIIMIDIDDFKKINDRYGHSFGDIVLRSTAKIIENLLDDSASVFRYGGEEFCILIKDKPMSKVIDLAENIRVIMEKIRLKENMKITISLGIGVKNENGDVLKLADENLYVAKNNGKNKVVY